MSGLLLCVDLGGSGLRASAVDGDGRIVARSSRRIAATADQPPLGRRWDPAELRAAALAVTAEAVAAVAPRTVDAVACTGQRIACAAIDGVGETIYAGPNADARGLTCGWRVDEAAGGELYEHTGRGLALLHAPARLLRLGEDDPGLLERVRHVVGMGEWLAHLLCGEVATDVCGATELLAHDVHAGEQWLAVWEGTGLDPGWLPPVRRPGEPLGGVTAGAAAATGLHHGTPVAVCPPDSMAALLGGGATGPGVSLVLAGSTMPVLATVAAPRRDPERRTWGTPHPLTGFVCEGNAGPTGMGWAWLAERLAGGIAGVDGDEAHALAERLAATAPAGAAGALGLAGGASVLHATRPSTFLPRMRVLAWPTDLLGADVGAAELLRAGIEEVAHSARANLEQAEAVAGAPGRLVLAGGMARSRLFARILASVCGRAVGVVAETDATALGAAACAAVAAGHHRDPASAAAALTRPEVEVEADDGTIAAYAEAHRDWRALYDRLESL